MLKKLIVFTLCCIGFSGSKLLAGANTTDVPPSPTPPPPPSSAELVESTLAKSSRSHAFALRFSPDSQELITVGATTQNGKPIDKRLRVWSVRTGKEIWRLPAEPCSPTSFDGWWNLKYVAVGKDIVMPDFKTMYTNTSSLYGFHKIDIHSFHFGKDLKIPRGSWATIKLSPDRKLLAVGAVNDTYILDAQTLKIIHTYKHGGWGTNVFWGPDSTTLLCTWTPNFGKPQAVDVSTAKQIHYPRWVYRVLGSDAFAFSPDGNFLAKAKDHTVEIWETPTATSAGNMLNTFTTKIDLVRVLQFSPDGKTLAVGGSSKTEVAVQFFKLSQVRK